MFEVSDSRSNANDQIAHAVKVLASSDHRLRVFNAVYKGKTPLKSVSALMKATGLSQVRVLQEGAKLDGNGIVHAAKIDGETAYSKDKFYKTHRDKILRLVRKVKLAPGFIRIKEKEFKSGVQKILGQPGKFQDWGGEKNDLLTTRLYFGGKRIAAAFAFKGRGMTGELTPAKMGANGDQIQRLFESAAQLFILQYWAAINERVREQIRAFATITSLQRGEKIYYCLIDGVDTARLIQAYPKQLRKAIK
jgi:hypothetical protein